MRNCQVGEDEAEEEEAEEVVTAVPGPSREVPSDVSEQGRFSRFVRGRVVGKAEDEAAASPFGDGARGAGQECS